ncbi:hypothetical protein CIG75_10620 [Tumebacillus algifaecis]|uniref:Carrier domain-containing protein n=1 Tax=Tumebacillus algifaecis TaxID=1214604 RepID=A0A223D174_9BACL|nr:non-ribosomal peptide synthetase [Tumebacillus algifaecis]ASS75398.1 hypothetical protein CIG75_10620 [Tumebacillus algifaecis]
MSMTTDIHSLVQVISEIGRSNSTVGLTFINGENKESFISYRDLYTSALGILNDLQAVGMKSSDEAVFQIDDHEDFVKFYWACLLGGIIPVPITVGSNVEHKQKFFRIWNTLNNPWLVADGKIASSLQEFSKENGMASLMREINARTVLLHEVAGDAGVGVVYEADPDDIAFIQFSSGSTGDPKGVVLTHKNLMTNINAIITSGGVNENDSVLSWMPLTHDMGLIGGHLVPLRMNIPQYSMTTSVFSRNPILWMKKANQYRATLLSSPNFGYQYLLKLLERKSSRDQEVTSGWDLSCVRLIFNGAEPISTQVCIDFLDVMEQYGMKRNVMYPVYGMAEASLAVTFPPPQEDLITLYLDRNSLITGERAMVLEDSDADNAVSFIDLGMAVENCGFRICDEENYPVDDLVIGNIQIKGNNVTSGYYNNQAATERAFTPDGWLITGDLGFTRNGRLIVTGRAKDIIFVNGQNYYAHDIERVVSTMPDSLISDSAAFSVFNQTTQQEDIMLAVLYRKSVQDFITVERELKKHINLVMGLDLQHIIPVKRIPKTTSGKVQRYKFVEEYVAGDFDSVLEEIQRLIQEEEANRVLAAPTTDMEASILSFFQEVVGKDRIDIEDNFFEIGGNSLRAGTLVAKIQIEYGVTLPLREIFNTPTVKALAAWLETAEQGVHAGIEKVEEKECYELSSVQKRLYILSQMDETLTSYNLPQVMTIEGPLDVKRFEKAFAALVQRHEIFRTSFELVEGTPMQRVHESVELKVSRIEGREEELERVIQKFVRPFDLSRLPLLRVGLMKCAGDKHVMLFDIHHIISDGTSMGILIKEFVSLYSGAELPELSIHFKDFSAWQDQLLAGEGMEQAKAYWLEQFVTDIPVLNLQTDFSRPSVQSFEGDTLTFRLDKELTEQLKQTAVQEGATLFMTLLAAYNVLLARYTGQNDIVVGSPVAGRRHADLDTMMGMFVNTLALRNQPDGEKSFKQFLQEVKENSVNAYEHQDYQFEALVEKLDVPRDMSRNPLFDVVFVLQNMELGELQVDQLKFAPYPFKTGTSKFDMSLSATEKDDTLEFELEYSTKLFAEPRMMALVGHFIRVLQEVVSNIDTKICEFEILTSEEQQVLVNGFNATEAPFVLDKRIHELFEEQAAKTPDRIAAIFKDTSLTYREVEERASLLAAVLRARGIGRTDIVGIMLQPSLDMVIGTLGILKAGAAFLPIDPAYPTDRIKFMLEDSRAALLLSQSAICDKVDFEGDVICDILEKNFEVQNVPTACEGDVSDLAYVIYTSGTTGNPKGVMVEHRSLVNFSQWKIDTFGLTEQDKVAKYAGFAFDVSVMEIFPTLICGAALYIIPEESRLDPVALNDIFQTHGITVSYLPTQLCEQFMQLENNSLRLLYTGGDKLRVYRPHDYLFYNCYGPTENTIVSTYHPVTEWSENISIGKPVANTQVYIVDAHHRLQPVGMAGELCVAGDNLARGYLNHPELTAEKFVPNPFQEGTRMYKTGDLARWLPDGTIEFLGRIDKQVKIRGHRIEIGEIEEVLLSHDAVADAVVMAHEDREERKYLVAYVVLNAKIVWEQLRRYAGQPLPDYMIPALFVQIDHIPLTQNGKIDWKALPKPEFGGDDAEFVAPVTPVEQKLAKLWQDVLGVKRVGLYDNFFDLGGHSLKVATLASKIHKEFGSNMPIGELFKAPTLQEQSAWLETAERDHYSKIERVAEADHYAASSAQRRLFVLSQLEGADINYNMPQVLDIEGELDVERFTSSFEQLVQRHESLRTSFELKDGEVVQKVHEDAKLEILHLEATEGEAEKDIDGFIRPFDLNEAPLIRVALLKLPTGKTKLLFDMHHIISDGVSVSILIQEFVSLYRGDVLPGPSIQYKDYSAWQQTHMRGEALKKQEAFWLQQFEGEVPVLDLATDYPRPSVYSFDGDRIAFSMNGELASRLKKLAVDEGATLYMALLALLNVLLHKYSGQEDIVIGSPVAGRNHSDLDRVIGMFVNTLALRNKPEAEKTFRQFLADVKHNALEAFENQDFPLEDLVEKLDLQRDMSRNPLFDVMFSLQNMERTIMETDGLTFTPSEHGRRVAKFDLTLMAEEQGEQIEFELEYCSKLFDKQTVDRLANHFLQLVETVAANLDVKLREISLLSHAERQQILFDFNETKTAYPKDKTIAELFTEQVEMYPNHIALVYGEEQLTYQELNERANSLAWVLKGNGVGPEVRVGLMVARSLEMMVGLLAIVKAGGAYVPVDPEYPAERVNYLLEDSGARLLLTTMELAGNFELEQELVDLEDSSLYEGDVSDPEPVNGPHDLAYILYTSGSTGKPKGVMVEHMNVVRLVKNTNFDRFSPEDRFLQLGAVVFDATTYEFWGSLLNGARLYLVDKTDILDAEKFRDVLKRYEITSMFITVSLFNQMATHDATMFSGFKNLHVGGEALSPKTINLVRNHCEAQVVSNSYGPTENTTFSLYYVIDNDYEVNIPIGRPISNSTAYVVDKHGNLQPIGVPGELWVGGDGVARGYMNRPDLTEEKFVDSPFVEGERIYKTGDLARWIPDGKIEYLGRIDEQVKIRGHRIEIGEVQAALLGVEYVQEAVVVAQEDDINGKYLTAYLVSEENLAALALRERLAKELPTYMIPAYLIQVERIPLTNNGKLNRAELFKMEGQIIKGNEYVAPSTPTEEKLAEIWFDILGLQNVGVTDNFFEMGGHSLNATVLVSRIQQECNAVLALKEVFKSPTIRELAVLVDSAAKQSYQEIKPAVQLEAYEQGVYPTSAAQRRMYLLYKMDEAAVTYNIPIAMVVEGKIDLSQMQSVFKQLIQRHESLRTSFKMVGGEILQQIHEDVAFDICYTETVSVEQEEQAQIREAVKNFVTPFNLDVAPLFRVELVKLSEEKHVMLFDIHHIVADGVSMEILTQEFIRLYAGQELEPLNIQYKDFVAWQNEQIETGVIGEQEKYWNELFSGEIPVLNLPTTYPRPLQRSFKGETLNFVLKGSLTEKLQAITAQTGTTMYMLLLAAFNVVLAKYSGQEDIVVGTPIAGRRHADLQNMIGMFVNTLSMRNAPAGSKTFTRFLDEVRENTLNAYENQDYQFEELVAKLELQRDLSRNPLFDVMFSLHSFGQEVFEAGGLLFSNHGMENEISKFDLSLDAVQEEARLKFSLEYAVDLYSKEAMERFISLYVQALEQIVNDPNAKISDLEILSLEERTKILVRFNATQQEYEKTKTLQQLFEERVVKQPDHPAVHFEGVTLTYAELNRKVNQLACRLREAGVQREELVPILCERSNDMIVGILSVLKAGGAYLPIDPYYPVDRIKFMLEDSQARLLLTHSRYLDETLFEGTTLLLDDADLFTGDDENLTSDTQPEDLAYVIYTSGSTGKPKGVMVKQRSVINLATWLSGMLSLPGKRFLHMSNVSFDNSVEEIFPQLISGATVYMLSKEDALDRNTFTNFVKEHQIEIVNLLPMTMKELLASQDKIDCLNHVMVGGDKLEESLKDQILSLGYTLTDHYGPTESTVDAIFTQCVPNKTVIGKPIGNTRIYIVDAYDKPVAIGVAGEICIAGDGLARGYLNRPDLTAEKFVPNPFEEGQRMYRTGDLAYWTEEGEIVYLGRLDNQIKIRGFRIELGEIEKQLLAQELVRDAIVIDRKDKQGNKYLCGYFVADQELGGADLRAHLLKELPDYMVPTAFVQLDRLPQTPNGKVDRKALPEPEATFTSSAEYVSARNDTESQLVSIWVEILSMPEERIGIHDSFFDLGGTSITVMQMTNLINDRFESQVVRVTDLFNYTTIEEIAAHIKSQLNIVEDEEPEDEIFKFTL